MSNAVLDTMEYYDDVPNRQNYLATAFPGRPPKKLDSESEAELPDEPRFQASRPTTHEEVAAEEAEAEKKSKGAK